MLKPKDYLWIVAAVALMILSFAIAGHAQNIQGGGTAENDQRTIAGCSGTVTFPDALGTINDKFEVIVTGSPATMTKTVNGLSAGGTVTLETSSTSTSSEILSTFDGPFKSWQLVFTCTGGTSPTITVNRLGGIARLPAVKGPLTKGTPVTASNSGQLVSSPLYIDAFVFNTNGDVCIAAAAAYTAGGANMLVDTRAFTGVNIPCTVDPIIEGASTPLVVGCNSSWLLSVQIVIITGTRVEGCDLPQGLGATNGAQWVAAPGWNTSLYMVCFGAYVSHVPTCATGSTGNQINVFNALLEWIDIDCHGRATLGVENRGAQENSGLSYFKVRNCAVTAVHWADPKSQHSMLDHGQIFIDNQFPGICTLTTEMLTIGDGANNLADVYFQHLTITIQGCAQANGSVGPTRIVSVNGCSPCLFVGPIHIEGGNNPGGDMAASIGMDMGNTRLNKGITIDDLSWGNFQAASGTPIGLQIENTANTRSINLRTIEGGGIGLTDLINDLWDGNTLTAATNPRLGHYTIGSVAGMVDCDCIAEAGITKAVTMPTMPALSLKSLTWTLGSGTAALGTGAIASGSCGTATTVAQTGALSTDSIAWSFNATPSGVTGYGGTAGGIISVWAYVTAGNVNFVQCNASGASITPGAATVNWRVTR